MKNIMYKLAIKGGTKQISTPLPHEIWPPKAQQDELDELAAQRNIDIGIKGRTGPIKEFEELFLKFLEHKAKYAVTFNSGTSALLASYFSIGIEEDDEVIGPALTYHAALSPIYFLKGNPVLVDIDINTRCIDPSKIEAAITERTKAIAVVHQWGYPADMDAVLKIAEKYKLLVVEDCSHAHGSKYKGKLCGTFGDVAAFSLQTNKAIFAGEGGIFITNNEKFYNRATLLGHYRDRSRLEITDPDYQKYWVTGFGLKLRMSPFNAIVAKHSLKHFPNRMQQKHKCLKYFAERLKEVDYIDAPQISDDIDMGAWYGFKPIYRKENLNNISREELITILQAEGMEVNDPSGPTLSTQPLYSETTDLMYPNRLGKKPNKSESTPNARYVEDNALSLPTFWDWERDKQIIDSYIDTFKKVKSNISEYSS